MLVLSEYSNNCGSFRPRQPHDTQASPCIFAAISSSITFYHPVKYQCDTNPHDAHLSRLIEISS